MGRGMRSMLRALALGAVAAMTLAGSATAQQPELVDPDLAVRTAASGLSQPVSMAFIGRGDMLVLEKASGQVKRVVGRRGAGRRARPGRELGVRARALGHRPAPEVP